MIPIFGTDNITLRVEITFIPQILITTAKGIFNLNLTINNTVEYFEIVTECDSYEWNGEILVSLEFYTFDTIAKNGCDSIVTLNLLISEMYDDIQDISVCDSYEWNDSIYTESGIYTFETTCNGCDSTAILNLTVYYSLELDTAITACNSFEWNEVLYTGIRTYNYQSTTSNGCDSTAVLYLTLGQTEILATNIQLTAMNGMIQYTLKVEFTNMVTTTQYGCDSISVLDLTIYNLETNFDEQEKVFVWEIILIPQLLNIASENQFETSVNDELIISEFLSYSGPSSFTSPYLEPGNYYLKAGETWCIGNCFNGHTVDAAFNFNDPYIQNLN